MQTFLSYKADVFQQKKYFLIFIVFSISCSGLWSLAAFRVHWTQGDLKSCRGCDERFLKRVLFNWVGGEAVITHIAFWFSSPFFCLSPVSAFKKYIFYPSVTPLPGCHLSFSYWGMTDLDLLEAAFFLIFLLTISKADLLWFLAQGLVIELH